MERRTFIVALGAAMAVRSARADPGLQFAELEAEIGGRVGVAAVDTRNGARLAHRADERFAICSTFKWMLAAAVLGKVERGEANLDRSLAYGPKDLLSASPVTRAHVAEGSLSVRSLCQAAVEVSDNTAANILLNFIGGPQSLTRYLRAAGDAVTRFDRMETSLNSNSPNDPRDTTMPGAMTATMQKVLAGNVLSADSRDILIGWLKNCRTGLHRLRAGLPSSWEAGDKTGTGDNGAVNDSAIIWPARRPPILIAAYLSDSRASPEALEAAHAKIGRIVATAFA